MNTEAEVPVKKSLRSYVWLIGQYGAKLAQGLILNKGIAYFLGLEKYGYFSFFQNLYQVAQAILNSSLSQSAIVSTKDGNEKNTTIPTIVFYIAGLVGLIWVVSVHLLDVKLLNENIGLGFLALYFVCFILLSMDAFLVGVLLKKEQLQKVFWSMAATTLLSVALGYFFLTQYDLLGAVGYLASIPITSFIFTWLMGFKGKVTLAKESLSAEGLKIFGGFFFLSVTAAVCYPLALYVIRLLVNTNAGIAEVSYWQACLRISDAYTAIVVLFFQRVFFVKATTESVATIKTIGKKYSFLVLLASPFAVAGIYLLGPQIIQLLFSSEFAPAIKYLPLFFIGDLFRFLSYPWSYFLLSKVKTKLFVGAEIGFTANLILLSWIGIQNFGFVGVAYAYILNSFLYYLFCLAFIQRNMHLF